MKFRILGMQSILILIFSFSGVSAYAQSLEKGIQLLMYQKNDSALKEFENLQQSNSNDVLIKYWYSQSLIENLSIEKAKNLYASSQSSEQDKPFGKVIKAQIELLKSNADIKFADLLFDSAILEAKLYDSKLRKKDKHIYSSILEAIGRANSQGGIKYGDANYGIKVLNEVCSIDKTNPFTPIYLGICYQKIGGDAGSYAAKSYLESINRNSTNPIAFWHLGKIYQAQKNTTSMLDYFSKVINADPNYPVVYLSLFEYYKEKDINLAKENLEKYVALADKNCSTNFYYADYLFRAGKYTESLKKANEMKQTVCKEFDLLPLLFAYNYERLNDSIQAKENIEYFFDHIAIEQIDPAYFNLAEKIYSKFPEMEYKLIDYIKRSYNSDTILDLKINYAKIISNIYEREKKYQDQFYWLTNYYSLRSRNLLEIDYYNLCKTALNAKNISEALKYSKMYLGDFPTKPQGYSFYVRAAKLNMTTDSTNGADMYLNALSIQNDYLLKDTTKYKKQILANYYNGMSICANDKKNFKGAMEYCDRYLTISPFDSEMQNNRKKILEILEKEQKNN